MQINRLFEIIYLLLKRKRMTASALAAHFEVSTRTIYRDVETLSMAGVPIFTSQGRGGGISLLEHYVLDKSLITESEQQQILSALQGFRATEMPSDLDDTLNKLQSFFNIPNQDWIEIDFSGWGKPALSKKHFEVLKKAIQNHNVVLFSYASSKGERIDRFVEPLKLVFKGTGWYLYGFCQARQDFRFFKLTRISKLKIEPETFSRNAPNNITSDGNLNFDTPLIPLVLKLDAACRFRVFDEFDEGITENPDGSFLVEISFPAGDWLTGYLLTFGTHLEVIEPQSIRKELKRIASEISTLYKT